VTDHDNSNGDGLTLEPSGFGKGTTATVTARLAGDAIACERFDLGKPKARASFAAAVCDGRPGLDRATIEAELLRLAADVANRPTDKGKAEPKPEPDRLASMPEAVRAEARAVLESPDLLQRIVEDVAALGVAGERELVATVYLVGTSRLLPRPLAAIVQGPSSSGKSYVIDTTATLFPPEVVVHATQMSPQALFHMKPGSLEHRFIVAGERSRQQNDETADTTRALREMISAGRLVKLIATKVGDGIETVSIEQEGPIAYVESTTLARIFDEDANRCIMLTTDEQSEQTRRIIERLAEGFAGSAADGADEAIIQRHHALQRTLRQAAIVVPYADRLGEHLAADRVEARRAFPQLVSMIQASALLHQRQRKVGGDGRLVAEADDYALARHLLARPFARLLGGRVSDPAARFLGRLRSWFPVGVEFSTREAAREDTASRSAVHGWVGELFDGGFLEQVEPSRGRVPAKWKLSEEAGEPDTTALLPTLEKLFP